MIDSPDTDALIRECAEWLRAQAEIFEGDLSQSTLNGFRFHAAQNWLKENPSMVLHIAERSRSAAQTMLTATGAFLAKGGEITPENRHAISRLLIKSEQLLSKKGGEARANRTMLNVAIVLLVEGLSVTSRDVVWLFFEQLRSEFVPVFHRLQGRSGCQC